ncbi:macrophage colony-stimulating factor 1a isoform X1 [Brienomyrus brachyistius]|uniref:macrophage colony-stimulating factor 1a isoform X1 n=1 Tax=Brienomyrus brachyistius TaxID=42636 RepID=UPI0020B2CEF1|nr:macrophage colony-stimulating factor 1a isoform X1 [Brienomyrus brachyistius]
MNTYKPDHIFYKAKARHRCFILILCFRLALGDVPGPCRHSATKDRLLNLKHLIANQLQDGCLLNYTFTNRQNLSEVCYVKAAFPQILDLLKSHFNYDRSSDNFRYVNALTNMIFNIYSQKCIPEINEEHEDHPVKFTKAYSSSPQEVLEKVQEVIMMYMDLMTENHAPVNWNCAQEYAKDYPESITGSTQSTGQGQGGFSLNKEQNSSSVGDSEKETQSNTSEHNMFYKTAFILALVCGGLLLTSTVYCYKKKLRTLHNTKLTENQSTQNETPLPSKQWHANRQLRPSRHLLKRPRSRVHPGHL